jgi:Ca2+/Na+ antiporter
MNYTPHNNTEKEVSLMLGIITLLIALSAQFGFLIYRLATKSSQTRVKHIMRIAAFIIFAFLMATGVFRWGFRWTGLFTLLTILAVFSAVFFIGKPRTEKKFKRSTAILSCISGCLVLTFCILPGILFPQFTPIAPTGSYAVDTTSVTFVDDSRVDPFSKTGENRKLTVQFWYPDVAEGEDTFPLAVFSHGAFGFRGSNASTFEDLASNGYVVCSIDHSYHAFFVKHTDGTMTFVNTEFLNDAVNITNGDYDEQTTYTETHEWLDLRTGDINFVLDKILIHAEDEIPESVAALINEDKIVNT